jgi:hypothetical protein
MIKHNSYKPVAQDPIASAWVDENPPTRPLPVRLALVSPRLLSNFCRFLLGVSNMMSDRE